METRSSFMKVVRPVIHLIVAAFLCYAALLIPQPFVPNLLLESLCPGENECSSIMYLVGALQLGIGIGAVVTAPILGGLSDAYGRKPVLLSVLVTAIIPQVVLACSKSQTAVYLWFPVVLIAYTFREAGFVATLLASVADVADENHRPVLNGITIGSLSVGYIAGTLASIAVNTVDQALWVSMIVLVCGTIYLKAFWKETNPREPLLPANESQSESAVKLLPKPEIKRHISTGLRETARTVWSSWRLTTIVVVDFLNSYALAGLDSFTVFYLIAAFDYGKKELSIIYLLGGVGSALGMTIVYPALSRLLGERVALWIGLLANAGHYLVYALAWTHWLPYVAAGMEVFHAVTKPAGKIQGFMAAARSVATILAPLTSTPLAAVSLGETPPFGLMGFPFFVCGSTMVLAWVISTGLPPLPPPVESDAQTDYIQAPLPPEEHTAVPSLN